MAALNYPAKPWTDGDIFTDNDIEYVYVDDGVNPGYWSAEVGGSTGYVLPIASNTVLGGIKVGSRLTITGDGTLSADAQGGGATVGNLQEVTDEGNTTTNGATFGGTVQVGDDSPERIKLFANGLISVRRDDGDILNVYKDGLAASNRTVEINSDGSANFAGTIEVGEAGKSGNLQPGTFLSRLGGISSYKNNLSGDQSDNADLNHITLYASNNPDPDNSPVERRPVFSIASNGNLFSDGSATFGGPITSSSGRSNFGRVLFNGDGTASPVIIARDAAGATDVVFSGRASDNTVTVEIKTDGSAEFSGGVNTGPLEVKGASTANIINISGPNNGPGKYQYRFDETNLFIGPGLSNADFSSKTIEFSVTNGSASFSGAVSCGSGSGTTTTFGVAGFCQQDDSGQLGAVYAQNSQAGGRNWSGASSGDGSVVTSEIFEDGSASFSSTVQVSSDGGTNTSVLHKGGFVYSTRDNGSKSNFEGQLNGTKTSRVYASGTLVLGTDVSSPATTNITLNGTDGSASIMGSVGIGTDNLVSFGKFAVFGTLDVPTYGNVSAIFSDGATGSARFHHDTGEVKLSSDQALVFGTGPSADERARIAADGSVDFLGDVTLSSDKIDSAMALGEELGALKFSSQSNTDFCSISGHRDTGTAGSGRISFNLSGSEKARFGETGNLWIGGTLDANPSNSTPNIALNVDGTSSFAGSLRARGLFAVTPSISVTGDVIGIRDATTNDYSYIVRGTGTVEIGGTPTAIASGSSPNIRLHADGSASLGGKNLATGEGQFRISSSGNLDSVGYIKLDGNGDFTSPKISLDALSGKAHFVGDVTSDGTIGFNLEPDNPTYLTSEGQYIGPTLDVKDKLVKVIAALEGLRDAASTSETLTDLKIAIVTALSQFQ